MPIPSPLDFAAAVELLTRQADEPTFITPSDTALALSHNRWQRTRYLELSAEADDGAWEVGGLEGG